MSLEEGGWDDGEEEEAILEIWKRRGKDFRIEVGFSGEEVLLIEMMESSKLEYEALPVFTLNIYPN